MFCIHFTVACFTPLRIPPKHVKLKKCSVTRVVTFWSYGNKLQNDLCMLVEFGNVATHANIAEMVFF